jgi:soluble lytic murein transglycosylase
MKKLLLLTLVFMLLLSGMPLSSAGVRELKLEELVPQIIKIESNGSARAISRRRCRGLMQISPLVLKEYNRYHPNRRYGLSDLYNPEANVKIGTWYLRRLRDVYLKDEYTLINLLVCWNWGYGNFRKWQRRGSNWRQLPWETRNFIRKLISFI